MKAFAQDGRDAPDRAAKAAIAISDLALIGDRRTAAVIDRDGGILWYCPGRFDGPSVFAALVGHGGGAWSLDMAGATRHSRRYVDDSAVLETRLRSPRGELAITDWMPAGPAVPRGLICRRLAPRPDDVRMTIQPRPNYARGCVRPTRTGNAVAVGEGLHLHASHPLVVDGRDVTCIVPSGEAGWAVLAPPEAGEPTASHLDRWLSATLAYWHELSAAAPYDGPYEREIVASLRAIRLLTHEESGAIVAAATTSLPEVPGGGANWDYRYVWLRDAGMIVSALSRLGPHLEEGRRYLDFICASRGSSRRYPVAVFTTLDGEAAPPVEELSLSGYQGSRPVRVGNDAREQMQLDAFGNVLLAAKLIYERTSERPHWDTVQQVAEFLLEHWREPDHGIWEEAVRRQYTSSKVLTACALDSVADYSRDEAQANRWRNAVQDIRRYVAEQCVTPGGVYAAVAGGEDVDVSAALYPVWAYTAADSPEMKATMAALERDWSWKGLLYWRRLECADSRREGAFLPGTFWVAQYWVMRGDLERARRILDAGLACATDLGLFAEEADPRGGVLLGNFPQAFVHAAFVGAVIDLKAALHSSNAIDGGTGS